MLSAAPADQANAKLKITTPETRIFSSGMVVKPCATVGRRLTKRDHLTSRPYPSILDSKQIVPNSFANVRAKSNASPSSYSCYNLLPREGSYMFSIFKSRRNRWRDEAKKLFDVYIASLKGLDTDEVGAALDLAKSLKSTMLENLPPGETQLWRMFSDPLGLPEDASLKLLQVWHKMMRSAGGSGEEAAAGTLAIWWLSLAAATFAELRVYGKEMWAELERGFPYCESFDSTRDVPQGLGKEMLADARTFREIGQGGTKCARCGHVAAEHITPGTAEITKCRRCACMMFASK
jgi:hypothetical protein